MVYVQKQIISYNIDDISADQITAGQFTGTHVGDVVAVDGTKLVDGTVKKIFAPSGFVGDLLGNAATVTDGVYTVGDQSISGVKTHSDTISALGGLNTAELRDVVGTNAIVISEAVGASAPKVTILGELVVQGDSTILNTNIVAVEDTNITLAKNNVTSSALVGSGLTISGGTGEDIVFQYSAENVMSLNIGMDLENGDLRVKDGNAVISGSLAAVSASITGSIEASDITADVKAEDSSTMLDGGTKTLTVNTVVAPSITGDVTGTVSDISNHTTDELAEGTSNLYYTDTRVHAALAGGTGVTYDGSGEFSIGQPVGTTDSVTFNDIAADGNLVTGGDITVNGGKVYVKNTGVGVELYSEQANNGMLRFHTSAGQSAFISTTSGNAPIQMTASLVWVRAINGGSGNALVDGDLQVDGTISSPTITALQSATSTSVAAEEAARIAADNVLQGNIDTLTADLATEESERKAEDATLQSNIDAEEAARIATDNTLQSNIDSEEAARISGDASTLVQATAYTDQEIAALVNSAPATLDTLKEIATALGDDPNLSTTLTNQIAGVQTNLDSEIATTDAEITALQAQDVVLQSNINTEATNRANADSQLQTNINTVQSNLDTEEAARIAADSTLQSNIDSEAATRASADTTLQNNIDTVASDLAAEIAATNADFSTLQTADATLQTNIDNEEAARISADNTLQTNITAEATTRAADDATLQSNIDAVAADLATEIAATNSDVSTLQAADTTLQSNIDTVAANLATEIATTNSEVSALQSADTTLQANIDAEEAARISADNTLTSAIATKLAKAEFGTYHDTEIASTSVGELSDVDLTGIQAGHVLKWDGSKLAPSTDQEDLTNNTTDDLAEGTTNLYYTDARADARVNLQTGSNLSLSSKTTDELAEGSTNLYYTDTRVGNYLTANGYALQTSVDTVQSNLDTEEASRIAGDASTLSSAQSYTDTAVANLIDSAPATLDTLNELAAALGDDPNFATTTTNLIGTKLNTADFDSTFDTRLATKTTSDLAEGSNLYYTDARVASYLSSGASVDINSSLNTGDITIDAGGDEAKLTFVLETNGGADTGSIIFTRDSGGADVGAIKYVRSQDSLNFYTNGTSTADVSINSSGTLVANNGITGNLTGNVTGTVSDISNHDTDSLSEGTTNLYYTDARADARIAAASVTDLADVDQSLATTDAVTFEKVTVNQAGVDYGMVINQNHANSGLHIDAVQNGITINSASTAFGGVMFRAYNGNSLGINVGTDGETTFNADVLVQGANLQITGTPSQSSHVVPKSYVDAIGNDVDDLVILSGVSAGANNLGTFTGSTIQDNINVKQALQQLETALEGNSSPSSTDDLSEGTTNLYFTDARSRSAISVSGDLAYNSTTGVLSFTERTDSEVNSLADARIALQTGANLDLSSKTTDNLSEGTSNLYYKDSRARGAISAGGDLSYNSSTGVISFTERTDAQVNGLADARIAAASIDDLSDVTVSAVATTGDLLRYNKSTGIWENVEITGTTNIEVEHTASSIVIKHGTGHVSKTYDNANNGTTTNNLPLDKAEVILNIAAGATNDVYLNLPTGTEGQELVLVIDSSFSSAYSIYIERTGGSTHPTNIYGTISLGSYSRTAVLRYCDTLGLWVLVGGDAYSSY